jgi:hypothetical protein
MAKPVKLQVTIMSGEKFFIDMKEVQVSSVPVDAASFIASCAAGSRGGIIRAHTAEDGTGQETWLVPRAIIAAVPIY